MHDDWFREEIALLSQLHLASSHLARVYLKKYRALQRMHYNFRIPSILLASVSGILIFGDEKISESGTDRRKSTIRRWLQSAVGIANLIVALMNTIETFLKIGETMERSLQAHVALKRISDDVYCELNMPERDRTTSGAIFMRDVMLRYQQVLDKAPTLSRTYELGPEMAIFGSSVDRTETDSAERRSSPDREGTGGGAGTPPPPLQRRDHRRLGNIAMVNRWLQNRTSVLRRPPPMGHHPSLRRSLERNFRSSVERNRRSVEAENGNTYNNNPMYAETAPTVVRVYEGADTA